jgi:hypothetical protein
MTTFSSMTSLGGKVSMSRIGASVNEITETESDTNVGDLRGDTTSSVEDSSVSSTGKGSLLERRQDIGNDTLYKKKSC